MKRPATSPAAWSQNAIATRLSGGGVYLRGGKLALALGFGALGGSILHFFHFPLAWMIGAMLLTAAASIAGAPIAVPGRLRSAMIIVIGVLLGSAFTPEVLKNAIGWLPSLIGLSLFMALGFTVNLMLLRRIAGFDPITAACTATPGGVNDMVIIGAAWGGDERIIALCHVMRIMIVVLTLPLILQFIAGYDPGNRAGSALGEHHSDLGLVDWLLLASCAVGGPLLARIRIPAAFLLGPMVLSMGLHLTGLTEGAPPVWLVAAAQIVLGSAIGCRFYGVDRRLIQRALFAAAMTTSLLILLAIGFSALMAVLTGMTTIAFIPAFAPGGLAEMSLIAYALDIDPAFVASHHLYRITLVLVLAPLVIPLIHRIWPDGTASQDAKRTPKAAAEDPSS